MSNSRFAIVTLAAALTLVDGGVYAAIARDAEGGGTPPGVILLDDFLN